MTATPTQITYSDAKIKQAKEVCSKIIEQVLQAKLEGKSYFVTGKRLLGLEIQIMRINGFIVIPDRYGAKIKTDIMIFDYDLNYSFTSFLYRWRIKK